MSYYDIKVYDSQGGEQETIRSLSETQMKTVTDILKRFGAKYQVKQLGLNQDIEGELPTLKGQHVKFVETSDSSKQHLVGKTGIVMHCAPTSNYCQIRFDDGTKFLGSPQEPETEVWWLLTDNLRVVPFSENYHHSEKRSEKK